MKKKQATKRQSRKIPGVELYGDGLKAAFARLAPELGLTDQRRLKPLVEMALSPGGIRLSECLVGGEGTPQAQQMEFRAFRKRVNDAAERAKIPFDIAADTNRREQIASRRVRFLGADPAVDLAINYAKQVTKDQQQLTFIAPDALKMNLAEFESGKWPVKVFISYAHSDSTLVEKFIDLLRPHERISRNFDFQFWYDPKIRTGELWDERIQKAIEESVAGIFLVTPSLLGSRYILTKELPSFQSGERYLLPISLIDVNLDTRDLKGLERHQIYRHGKKSFEDLSTAGRRKFVDKVITDLEQLLLQGQPPSGTAALQTKPPKPKPELVYPKEEDAPFIDPMAIRWTAAEMEKYEPGKATGNRRNLCTELLEWAADTGEDASRYAALLGEVGMGKTTTLKHLTRLIVQKENLPVPIYLDLRYYQDSKTDIPQIEQIIQSVIDNSWRVQADLVPTAQDVVRLVRDEDALIIFDGLDEQLVAMTPANGRTFLRKLWSVQGNSGKGRIIVSCRSHYFRDIPSQNSALSGDDREGLNRERFLIFCLMPFNERQISSYLSSVLGSEEAGKKALEMLGSIHNLRDLAERPYLLKLIAPRLQELEQLQLRGDEVNAARLYELVVENWLNRDEPKHQINIAHKRLLMEELAAALWKSGNKRWRVDRLEAWFDEFLFDHKVIASAYPDKPRDVLKEDLRTATFVLRPDTEKDSFGFAHTSLQEYFLASYLARAMEEEANAAERWDMPRVSWETFEFIGQILQNRGIDARRLEPLLTSGGGIAPAVQAFGYWVTAAKRGYPAPSPSQPVNLAGADLEGWTIRNLSLRNINLSGANLHLARLESVDLSGAGTDLTGVDAREAVFIDVAVEGIVKASGDGLGYPAWRNRNRQIHGPERLSGLGLAQVGGHEIVRLEMAGAEEAAKWRRPFLATGHSGRVLSCAITSDDAAIVSASDDNTLKLWDRATGQCLQTFSGHSGPVRSCAITSDDAAIVSASSDKTLKLWDRATGQCLQTFSGHTGTVWSCAITSDDAAIVSASADKTLKLWDRATGQCLQTFSGHTGTVWSCAITSDDAAIVSASDDNTLKLWDRATGQCLQTFSGHSGSVWSCAITRDDAAIVSASDDKTLKLWDRATGQCLQTFSGHSDYVRSCAITRDDAAIVSASADNTLKLWDRATGQCLQTFSGHSDYVWSCAITRDDAAIVSASSDKTLKLWDRATGQCLQTFSGHSGTVWSCAITSDDAAIVSASADNTLKLWDRATGQCLQTFSGHSDYVRSCAITSDDAAIVSASADKTLKLWDRATGQCLQTFSGHTGTVWSCAITSDDAAIVSASDDNTLKLWDRATGQCLQTFSGHSGRVRSCAITRDDAAVVSASDDKTLKLWDRATGQCLQTFSGHSGSVLSCAITRDDAAIVSASDDNTLKLWDRATGQCLQTFSGHSGTVWSCAITRDDAAIVSASADNTLKLWDRATGQCLQTFSGHSGRVWSCAITCDGAHIVSTCIDGTMKVWAIATGQCVQTFCHLPEGNTATIGPNEFQWASREAWRWLGYQVSLPPSKPGGPPRPALLPCDAYGKVPGLDYEDD